MPLDLAFGRRELASTFHTRLTADREGSRVAYTVRTHPEESPEGGDPRFLPNGVPGSVQGQRVHITEIQSGATTEVGPEGAASWRASWSPDGKQVAFYSDHGGQTQLWVHDVASGESRRVSEARIKAKLWRGDEPYWSPDGSELFVPLAPEGDDPSGEAGAALEAASAGATVTVYRAGEDNSTGEQDGAGEGTGGSDHSVIRQQMLRENNAAIGAIRVDDGSVRTVVAADAVPRPSVLQVSPSGRWVSYLSVFRPALEKGSEMVHDLAVMPASGGEVTVLASAFKVPDHDYYLGSYVWHPTRDQLFWVQDGGLWTVELGEAVGEPRRLGEALGEFTIEPLKVTRDGGAVIAGVDPWDLRDYRDPHPRALAVVPLDGGAPRVVALPDGVVFEHVVCRDFSTAWEPVPGTVTILAKELSSAQAVMARIEVAGGAVSTVWKGLAKLRIAGASADHQSLIGSFEDHSTPADLHTFYADGRRTRVTTIEPRLDGVGFGAVETFETPVPQGDGTLTAATTAVLLPAGASRGDRLPAVMFFYPGARHSAFAAEYGGGMPSQVPCSAFTTRGYAVLLVDAPIGDDGKEPSNPLEELAAVLVPQVYHAAELGYVDLERVAIAGQSYGGYGTAATISATNVFAAAVAIDGLYDLPGSYGWLHQYGMDGTDRFWYYETGQGKMGTHPWADLQRYLANSPYYRADHIRTPLLLLHGAEDLACPVEDAGKMFHALKRLDQPVQLAIYAGEGHAQQTWSRVNAVDATQRMLDFLDEHLRTSKGGEQGGRGDTVEAPERRVAGLP